MTIRRYGEWLSRVCLVGWVVFLLPCAQAAESQPLSMGVFPYLSTRALLDVYQPIRIDIAEAMKRPVHLFTAQSFEAYADQARQGAYDILITPPHFALLAQRQAGYIPLVVYTRKLRGIFVVARNSAIHGLQDLKGKRIATPTRLALVTIMGRQWLRENGLAPNADVVLLDRASHANAVEAVRRGDAEAAITTSTALAQMSAELRDSVRVVAQTPYAPHVMYLVHPRLGKMAIERIKAALLAFPATQAGQAFLKVNGFEGMRPVEAADIKRVQPYVKELERLLAPGQP